MGGGLATPALTGLFFTQEGWFPASCGFGTGAWVFVMLSRGEGTSKGLLLPLFLLGDMLFFIGEFFAQDARVPTLSPWLSLLTQTGWSTPSPLFLVQGGGVSPYFEFLLVLEPALSLFCGGGGGGGGASGMLVLLLTHGGWVGRVFSVLFLAQGGDGVELLLFFRYWLMGLPVWIEHKVHQYWCGEIQLYCPLSIGSFEPASSRYFTKPCLMQLIISNFTIISPMMTISFPPHSEVKTK